MINIQYSNKGTPYVMASELYNILGIEMPLGEWFPSILEYGFVENEEYSLLKIEITLPNGIPTFQDDWAVRLDMAKHIAMIQKTETGKQIRQYLIDLDKQITNGAYLSHVQMSALFDLCEILGYFTVQETAEQQHFNYFIQENDKKNWWKYRADVLGFSKEDLEIVLTELGKKYKNQRQALYHYDRYELIKVAVVDLLMAMGRTKEYATNVSKFAKGIAERVKPSIYDDSKMSIDFKSNKQKEIINNLKTGKSGLLQSF
ncbi:antA/AntB antirepressor family protein [Arcicella lustrica]|uniref:AntA/AntB antirepressor family protein n=1 Tax=Arcicella lustrica TaxID=2984196 RepID=A0ABU5SCN9_9BACT|nr:antA/AntB antirepressor family protein [Arcicella sp. DC25W]MEA5425059.1 antA/AntB antirepressor family protein [Arcicella sp. DC25W]